MENTQNSLQKKIEHLKTIIAKFMFTKKKPNVSLSIKSKVLNAIEIIEQLENKTVNIKLAQNLQKTLSNDPNLLTSQQQMETVNEINQTINQLTEELEKFFATIIITPSATLPKKKRENPFFQIIPIISTLPRKKPKLKTSAKRD